MRAGGNTGTRAGTAVVALVVLAGWTSAAAAQSRPGTVRATAYVRSGEASTIGAHALPRSGPAGVAGWPTGDLWRITGAGATLQVDGGRASAPGSGVAICRVIDGVAADCLDVSPGRTHAERVIGAGDYVVRVRGAAPARTDAVPEPIRLTVSFITS